MSLLDLRDLNASWEMFPPVCLTLRQIRDMVGGFFEVEFDDGPRRETSAEEQAAAAQRIALATGQPVPVDAFAPLSSGPRPVTEVHGARPAAVRGRPEAS